MRLKIIGLLAALSFSLPVMADLSARSKQQLDNYLATLGQHNRMMLSVALSEKGKPIYTNQQGYAALESQQTLNADTQLRIGSISKTFTAVMVMQLVEQGKLQLDWTLGQYFPDFPNSDKITIQQLLTHRSGLFNFTDAQDYSQYMQSPQSHQQMLDRFLALPPNFDPDEKQDYSNTNYYLLSLIIEKASGKSYAEVLNKQIVEPLALKRTGYGGKITPEQNQALSYQWQGDWQRATETDMSVPFGAGALVSTASELNQFFQALFSAKLVSADSLKKMQKMQPDYGFALSPIPFNQYQLLGHSGGIDGFVSMSAYLPEKGLAITALSNGVNYSFNDVLIAMLSACFDMPVRPPEFATAIDTKDMDLQRFVGNYVSSQLPLEIKVFVQDKQLFAQASGQGAFPLTAVNEREFVFEQAGIRMSFDATDEPQFSGFVLKQGGGVFQYQRKPAE
ncbi:serine hydrolase domain-containing protein [Bowmanella denitrificans]|uniref:serine hydrolase domain-containing protein n=1 Tax=Bowmanella denitrificans TaxID=366582 RepID=UPI00155843A5|nr:serine hydrolase domain-containing protein [Bowmanella denitrificans]